jgi:hypothetical protein
MAADLKIIDGAVTFKIVGGAVTEFGPAIYGDLTSSLDRRTGPAN